MARFDIRRSPVDGKYRRWVRKPAVDLGLVEVCDIEAGEQIYYTVWVVDAVFDTRREAYAGGPNG